MRADFDDYKDTYRDEVQKSIAFIGQDAVFFTEVKARYLLELVTRHHSNPSFLKVLDIGCGVGTTDRFLTGKVGELHGVDIAEETVEQARKNLPEVHYQSYDGKNLPFSDNTFDVVFAINVMHHVPPEDWENFTREMRRVLKPGGLALVFEHNPLNPLTRKAVRECAFDEDAVLLSRRVLCDLYEKAGLTLLASRCILFTPFRGNLFAALDRGLGKIPLGAQHYAVARKAVS